MDEALLKSLLTKSASSQIPVVLHRLPQTAIRQALLKVKILAQWQADLGTPLLISLQMDQGVETYQQSDGACLG